MIKHIVMFRLKSDKKDELDELRRKLDNLKNTIEEVRSMETGINVSRSVTAYDLVFVSEFETLEELEKYRVHPEHQKVLEYISSVKDASVVVDYKC